MANRYKSIVKADQKNVDGGYKNVVQWAPRDTFLVLAAPTPGGSPASGDSLKITADHTFTSPAGFFSWLCNTDSVTIKGKSEDGAMVWTAEFELLGDDASTQEQLEDQLNDNCVFLFKDANCITATDRTQLGDDCKNPKVEVEFDGKTTESGKKIYKVSLKVKKAKYFYSGVVTAHA